MIATAENAALTAALVAATARFGAAVNRYHAFTGTIADVRNYGGAVKVALHRLENAPGDVDPDAYLDAVARGRRAVRAAAGLVAAHIARHDAADAAFAALVARNATTPAPRPGPAA